MKNIKICQINQVRNYTDKHLAKYTFTLDCGSLSNEEFESLLSSLKNKTLRKDRFKIENVFYNNKYRLIDASSLHGWGYSMTQDFEDLFNDYNLIGGF